MNPMTLMKLKGELAALQTRHPKFTKVVQYLGSQELPAGTVLDVEVKTPDGGSVHANLKLDEADRNLIALLRELGGEKK